MDFMAFRLQECKNCKRFAPIEEFFQRKTSRASIVIYYVFDFWPVYSYNIIMNIQQKLDSLLRKGVEQGCFPGAVAACGCRGEVSAISWAGKISLDGPLTDRHTRYDMASLTKILCPTMIALRAIEDGDLTLYDTLETHFPNVPDDKRSITIRQLMSHSAGFEPAFWLSEETESPDDALAALFAHPLAYAPGEDVRYSCMGYITLGKLLEKLYEQPLNHLAEEKVFRPLNMTHTGYLPEGGNIAATEVDSATGKAWQGIVHDENARFLRGVSANAGIFSCIDDMILFAQMLANGADGYLAPATLSKAIRCHAENGDIRRGLGFHLAGTPFNFMGDLFPECSFGHTGFTGTSLAVDPTTGFYLILLSNRVHPTRENLRLVRFRRTLHNAMYAEFSRERMSDK